MELPERIDKLTSQSAMQNSLLNNIKESTDSLVATAASIYEYGLKTY